MSVDYVMAGLLTGDYIEINGLRADHLEFGGGCVYAAAGARVWTDSIGIASVAGTDYPQEWLDILTDCGLDTSGIARVHGRHGTTLLASDMTYNEIGDRPELDLAPTWSPPGSQPAVQHSPAHTFLDLEEPFCPLPRACPPGWMTAKGLHLAPMSVRVQEQWLKAPWPDSPTITLDSFWWEPGASAYAHLALLARISALLPSKAEVSAFFGGDFTPSMMTALTDLGAPIVAVKLGRDGCAVLQAGAQMVELPTCAATVSDPTGAGDAFCGGFLVGLTDCGDPIEAALRGTVSASFAVEGFGLSRLLSVEPSEARNRLHELRATMVQ